MGIANQLAIPLFYYLYLLSNFIEHINTAHIIPNVQDNVYTINVYMFNPYINEYIIGAK